MATIRYDNAPSVEALRLERFRSVMNYYGPAKSSRFMVIFSPKNPNFNNLTGFPQAASRIRTELPYLCEAAELPGRGFQSVDARYYGPNEKLPFQTTFEDINLTFICRAKSLERQFFDDWMNIVHPPNDYNLFYRDDYSCDIDIFHFSDAPLKEGLGDAGTQAQYYFKLHDAYPTIVNPQTVTWADSEFLRLAVSFTYVRWTRPKIDPEVPADRDLIAGATIVTGGNTIT